MTHGGKWPLTAVALVTLLSCAKSSTQPGTSPPEASGSDVAAVAEITSSPSQPSAPSAPAPEPEAAPEPEPLPDDYIQFSAACGEGPRITIGAVGDVLLHRELQKFAVEDDARFRGIWAGVAKLLAAPDLTYGNLEGPVAPGLDDDGNELPDPGLDYDGVVYSGYPHFNYHPSAAVDLKRDGVDVVSTANNHALDRGGKGVDRTLTSLNKAGLKSTGTRASEAMNAPWYAVTEASDFHIAWIACTRHTNQRPDDLHQVLRCDNDRREITRLVKRLATDESIDAVIVTPHIGKQYLHEPHEREVRWVHEWLDAGATAVIGNHPHVVRPWEKYVTADGRETFAIYSLGNFVSHQPELPRRTSLVLYLGLIKGEDGVTRIEGVRYVPTHVLEKKHRYFAHPVTKDGGPADSRAHLISILGAPNLMEPEEVEPGEPIVTAPHCDPDWKPERSPVPPMRVPAPPSESEISR